MQKNIDLLCLEMRTLWERDRYGRLRSHPLVALAVADDGVAVRFHPALPLDLRESLETVPVGNDSIEKYRRLIELRFPVEVRSGPSYVFPQEVVPIDSAGLEIVTSDGLVPATIQRGRPEAWWGAGEWEDLLAGRLGPWAIGRIGGEIVAICHTPVGSSEAAEAGVWTHPEARGEGYAPAVTSAWAGAARKEFGTLFYSTSSENFAS